MVFRLHYEVLNARKIRNGTNIQTEYEGKRKEKPTKLLINRKYNNIINIKLA